MIVYKRNKKKLAIPSSVGNIDFIINGYTEEELEKKYEEGYRTGFVEGYERGTETLGVFHPQTLSFRDNTYIVDFKFGNIRFDKIAVLNYCFNSCVNLESVDFTGVGGNGQNVNMNNMFANTTKLKHIDLSPLKDVVISDVGNMFFRSGVEELDFSMLHFNITGASQFCRGCQNLISVNISNMDLSRFSNGNYMFYSDSNLKNVICENTIFPTGDIRNMFGNCGSLSYESVSNIINQLPIDENNNSVIGFDRVVVNNMPQELRDLASSKGWSIVVA